jgi:hypothetical protein
MARVNARASGAMAPTASSKKVTAPLGRRIPPARMSVEASSAESHESSPHNLLSKAALKPACDASLQVVTVARGSRASSSHAVATTSTG